MASDLQSVLQQDDAFQAEKQQLKKKIRAQQEAKTDKLNQSIRSLKAQLKSLKADVDAEVSAEAEQLKAEEVKRLEQGRAAMADMVKRSDAVADFLRQQLNA